MNIRNKKTYFSSLPEGQAPANPAKTMSSSLYFIVLFAIVGYLIFYAMTRVFYLETRGQVEVGRYLIHANLDGNIDKILVSQEDSVTTGQTLATILQPPTNRPSVAKDLLKTNRDISKKEADIKLLKASYETISSNTKNKAALPSKIIKLDNDIRLKKVRVTELDQLLNLTNSNQQFVPIDNNNRLLELSRQNRESISKAAKEKQALAIELSSARKEVEALNQYRKELLEAEKQALALKIASIKGDINLLQNYLVSLEQGGENISSIAQRLTSPIDGEVQAIFKLAGEQTSTGEAVLALRDPEARVAIHGYFKEDQLSHLKKGKKVKVTFADNSHSTGIISNHYSIASSYREKLKDEYIPIQSAVLVEIIPANSSDETNWRKFDRLDVTIKVKK